MPERWAQLALPWRVVLLQAGVTLLVTLALMLFLGGLAALSALMGGGVVVLPNAAFARTVLRRRRVPTPVQARVLVLAGYAKLVSSLLLMILVFAQFAALVPQAFFGTLVVALALHWAAPLLEDR